MTPTLYDRIRQFYDSSSSLWEQIWGEHMHHGYYGPKGDLSKERRQAQVDLIDELLKWAEVSQARQILDVGCGIGGSSLYLADRFQAGVIGITLSPVQADRARERARAAGLSADPTPGFPSASFQVADALHQPFLDEAFDLVWSLESGEHMPDKEQFLRECWRVLKPGGTFLMATWCHRPLTDETQQVTTPLTPDEKRHLMDIYRVYCLPYVISLPEYATIAHNLGFTNLRTADWSEAVAPFWNVVIQSAISPTALLGVVRAGWMTMRAALSLQLMRRGYQRGLIRFGLLSATKSGT